LGEADGVTIASAEPATSPLSLTGLRELFFAPRRFFSHGWQLNQSTQVQLAAWIVGMAYRIDPLDYKLAADGRAIGNLLFFWLDVLLNGMINGFLLWYLTGWWYRKRLEWAAVPVRPDPQFVRVVNTWQNFVFAAPTVLYWVVLTIIFRNDYEAQPYAAIWKVMPMLFFTLSCFTSYVAVKTAFRVSRGHAAFWFVALPLIVFAIPFVLDWLR